MKFLLIIYLFTFELLHSSKESSPNIEATKNKNRPKDAPQQNLINKLSFHQPTYIIAGEDDVKLQFSFKYRLVEGGNFYLDYSQKLFWNLYESSQPFRDINHSPGIFQRITFQDKALKSIDLGYTHSSNGKDGEESRSLDQIYGTASWLFETSYFDFAIDLNTYYTFYEDEYTEDITKYIGYYKISFGLHDFIDHVNLDMSAFAGDKLYNFDGGAFQVDLRYKIPGKSFNPDLLIQYYKGHAENLLQYDKKDERIRAGLVLTM